MEQFKGTQGTWKAACGKPRTSIAVSHLTMVVETSDSKHAIAIIGDIDNMDTVIHNAALIAAAPDLLAACQFAVQLLDGLAGAMMQDAIDKALDIQGINI